MFRKLFADVFPHRGDSGRDAALKIVSLAAFVVAVVCLTRVGMDFARSAKNRHLAGSLAAETSSTPVSSQPYPAGMLARFQALYDQNPDIKGWITIAGTGIDYPVVQTADNSLYLTNDFHRQKSDYGTLFLDYRDSIQPSSRNLIIYGHNMKDGQMFHNILKYQQTDFYNSAPVIQFDTLYGAYKWKVFACFIANASEKDGYVFNYLRTDFPSDGQFTSFINEASARSLIKTAVDVQPTDTILTLSTCTYEYNDARFVVMARRLRDGESEMTAPATRNKTALNPLKPMS